jgi:2'-5' RNA ligase
MKERQTPKSVSKLHKILKDRKVKIGGLSVFENKDATVLKFSVNSPELTEAKKLVEAKAGKAKAKGDFSRYVPHITLAYLKPGTPWKKYKDKFDKELRGKSFFVDRTFGDFKISKGKNSLGKTASERVQRIIQVGI